MRYAHMGLNVTNLEKSISFYSKMFGQEPVKRKPGYAKFLLEKPGLNMTLTEVPAVKGNQVNHFGIQVDSTDEVHHHMKRLREAGLSIELVEQNTTCCYALQDKFWVIDPDGNRWEFFYTKADVEHVAGKATACCTTD